MCLVTLGQIGTMAAFSFKTGHPLEWLAHSSNNYPGSIEVKNQQLLTGCSSAANTHMSKATFPIQYAIKLGPILSTPYDAWFRVHPHFP